MNIQINDEALRKAVVAEVKEALKTMSREDVKAATDAAVKKATEALAKRLAESNSYLDKQIVAQIVRTVTDSVRDRVKELVAEAMPTVDELKQMMLEVMKTRLDTQVHLAARSLTTALLQKNG
jgi:transglutaminase/protease-like cytokinesis protein 3